MKTPQYDVFISFASEDKETIVEPLVQALINEGLNTWYASLNLLIGDSITDKINDGLINSKYGVVILSPAYFQKTWAMTELKALFVQETVQKKKRILPIWHKISFEEVQRKYPIIADRYAVSSDVPIEAIVDKLLAVINGEQVDLVPISNIDSSSSKKQSSGNQYINNKGAKIKNQFINKIDGNATFNL